MESTRVIELNERGFVIRAASRDHRVDWDQVREIATYKVDLFSYDTICLAFTIDDSGTRIEVDEEVSGFSDLMQAIGQHFSGIPADWYLDVMHPAFATNFRVLWSVGRREASP